MRVRDRHTVKRLSICNAFNSAAIQCCTARVVITSCLGANMRQRVNVLWRQRENFCCNYTPTLCSETWFSSSALIRHNVLIDTIIFNQLEGEKVSTLLSYQLSVSCGDWFPPGYKPSSESQVVSHLPPNQEKMKRSQQHWQDNYVLPFHFAWAIYSSITVQLICMPLTLKAVLGGIVVPV